MEPLDTLIDKVELEQSKPSLVGPYPLITAKKLCQYCKSINFNRIYRTLGPKLPEIPLHGLFIAPLPLSHVPSCAMCRLFSSARVPISDFRDNLVPQASLRYHLRAYSGLKVSRDINYASLPSLLKERDCIFFAVVPDTIFPNISEKGPLRENLAVLRNAQVVENHGWKNGYICRADSEKAGDFFSGRMVQRFLDYSILRGWMDFCNRNHYECRVRKFQTRNLHSVKVIHCPLTSAPMLVGQLPKVVLKPIKCQYAALSYVWGRLTPATTCPEPQLRISGMEVPKVVLDAITITQKMGLEYLWVDRFCIPQDNPSEKHDQINQMGDIYRAAHFTIVAAAGSNDSTGIPGVQSLAREHQCAAISKTLTLLSTLSHPTYSISQTTWATRGWTYQEAVFSRRRIVFTPQQVYFECCGMQCVEALEIPLDHILSSDAQRKGWAVKATFAQYIKGLARPDAKHQNQKIAGALPQFAAMDADYRDLQAMKSCAPFYRTGQFSGDTKVSHFGFRHMANKFQRGHRYNVLSAVERLWLQIEEYCARNLTYDHDGLNAFEGILKDARQVNRPVLFHISGLPILLASVHFMTLQALLWSTGGFIRAKLHDAYKGAFTFSDTSTRRPSLPSWSWAGWTSKIHQPEVKIYGLDWSLTNYFWPRKSSTMASVWLAIVSLENSLGDSLHCGESQINCLAKLPLFEKTIYLHLEAYPYLFQSRHGQPTSWFRTLMLRFTKLPMVNASQRSTKWSQEKMFNSQWALTLESHHTILEYLARGQSLLIPLMSNEKSMFVLLVDIMAGDLVERRGIIRFDRLHDQETISSPVLGECDNNLEQGGTNIDEVYLQTPQMVMVV